MLARYAIRMMKETSPRLLGKFAYTFGWKGMRAVQRFQKRLKRGEQFPAFLFISLTNNCNLRCQGCWVTPTQPVGELSMETLNNIINESKSHGAYFFGLLGGEPLLYPGLFEIIGNHPDCYFLLFTNGTLITRDVAEHMRRLGNVSPLISIEGNEIVSDERRGGTRVYNRTLAGLEHCRAQGLITGVATSVCKSNINDLANEAFIHQLTDLGVHYAWYYIYRPVGPQPMPELALSENEILDLRRFIVNIRKTAPLMVVDSYWDHLGRALCPAAVGIAHHIGPNGDIEPCPPIQFARENVNSGKSLTTLIEDSAFLDGFKKTVLETTRGCIIMEDPALLRKTIEMHSARDSSGRNTALSELAAMNPMPSHHIPGNEIPEVYWPYRIAKKYWFFGFGAYG